MAKANITVPIIFLEHMIPSVSLEVNGKNIDKISIDTGASSAFYFQEKRFDDLVSNDNKKHVTIKNSIDVFGVKQSSRVLEKTNLTINGENLLDMEIEEFKPWGNGMLDEKGNLIIDAVLGLGIVNEDVMLIIDYISNKLTITSNSNKLPNSYLWEEIPFIRTQQGIVVNVLSDEDNLYKMVIDTGASRSVIFSDENKGCENISLSCPMINVNTPDSINIPVFLYNIGEKKFNFDGLLGHDYLHNRVLIISNNKLFIGSEIKS